MLLMNSQEWQLWRTNDGDLYFFNTIKCTTQWERPKFYSNTIACNDSEAWRCYKSSNSDPDFTYYYENLFTKEVTWFVYEECESLMPYNDSKSWIAYTSDSQEPYFYNIYTKESTWKRPKWIKEDLSNVKTVERKQNNAKKS